ncbi:hypothetical protein [uncultured Sunxiuqinia sp.]|uniref:hypothetical protein n=1 Tax=uncultured Sunxiuqinia sp. TaxID=1573825 RepID=UPI002AA8302B|nr:hypothetical protein [uncultured Sunxiuqinia sp.]
MKRTLLTLAIVIVAFLLNQETASAQVTVAQKPTPPEYKLSIAEKPGTDYQQIPGHWIWHRPSKMYVWVGPRWVEKKENKKWRPGHWQKQSKGWKWNPGKWEKIKKKRYFFK